MDDSPHQLKLAIGDQPIFCGTVVLLSPGEILVFSHIHYDGSIALLAPQPSTYTKFQNLYFLLYFAGLLLQQHIFRFQVCCVKGLKLTFHTTVYTQLMFSLSG